MLETGIHLPCIQVLFEGKIFYKDFLYWRGPLELLVPYWMMNVFGKNMIWLPVFYYFFTVMTLCAGLMCAFLILRTRFIFYLFIPVLIARTFPRVSFYYWGGLRYAVGLLAVFCAIQYFRTKKYGWIYAAGSLCALSFWTTLEAGFSTVGSIVVTIFLSFFLKL